jgi:hypothetical protein
MHTVYLVLNYMLSLINKILAILMNDVTNLNEKLN